MICTFFARKEKYIIAKRACHRQMYRCPGTTDWILSQATEAVHDALLWLHMSLLFIAESRVLLRLQCQSLLAVGVNKHHKLAACRWQAAADTACSGKWYYQLFSHPAHKERSPQAVQCTSPHCHPPQPQLYPLSEALQRCKA